MPPQKSQKIDLNKEYPCPSCRRRGTLQPITLTEAFGCDRCHQIFVVEDKGRALEQLSTTYPYKRAWRWTGSRWVPANAGIGESYLPVALAVVLLLLMVWLPLALRSPSSQIVFWVVVCVLIAILPALMVWLSYRR